MFAIIRTGGKQYKVSEGDVVTVEKIGSPKGEVLFSEVLLLSGEKVAVGKPTVTRAKVTGEILSNHKGDKIRVFKFKAKSHWSKTHGHRQLLTDVRIKKITGGKDGA
jgi:large subunit ribosomal protein L21